MTPAQIQKVRDALLKCDMKPKYTNQPKDEALRILDAALAEPDVQPVGYVHIDQHGNPSLVNAEMRHLSQGEHALYLHPSSDAKDAARYRWLRDKGEPEYFVRFPYDLWDERIDTAMQGEQK